jgi:hypothetical protein
MSALKPKARQPIERALGARMARAKPDAKAQDGAAVRFRRRGDHPPNTKKPPVFAGGFC